MFWVLTLGATSPKVPPPENDHWILVGGLNMFYYWRLTRFNPIWDVINSMRAWNCRRWQRPFREENVCCWNNVIDKLHQRGVWQNDKMILTQTGYPNPVLWCFDMFCYIYIYIFPTFFLSSIAYVPDMIHVWCTDVTDVMPNLLKLGLVASWSLPNFVKANGYSIYIYICVYNMTVTCIVYEIYIYR